MECRAGCGACCIAPSISSAIPGIAAGKPAVIHVQVDSELNTKPPGWEQFRAGETEIAFSYTEPWLLGAPVDVSVAGAQSVRDTLYTTTEGDLSVAARVGNRTRLTWSLGALLAAGWLIHRERMGWGFVMTTLTILFTTATLFVALYPRVMVSSLNPDWSLTVYNASSTPYTLKVMSIVAAIFVPIVLAYQAWTYWVFRHRITAETELEY